MPIIYIKNKKEIKKMKKALRKLIPAFLMLLIAAAFVGTSTFAWFSMNRTVTVTGMSVDTKVSDSLSIAAENAEENYTNSLSQARTGHLRPVSTVDGVNFFYNNNPSTNVAGNGSSITANYVAYSEAATGEPATNALANAAAGKTNYDATFQTTYAVTGEITTEKVIYGYIDYVFYIKATNVTGSAEDLKLTTLNLLYNDSATETPHWVAVTEKAWRVAVFAQSATKDTANNVAPTTGDRKAMLTLNGAHTFAYDSSAMDPAEAAANSTSSTGAVTYTSSSWAVDSIAAGATEYNKVTIRLWLEGEDNTCNNDTFATLTNKYKLDLGFHLAGSEAAVLVIGSTAA